MSTTLSFRMAYRHVSAAFGRMVLSIVALTLGVALVVAIQLMNAAVLDSFLETIDGMVGRAALTVTAGEGLTFDEDLVEGVTHVPGVVLAVPLVTGVAFPDDGSQEILTVHGVDIANDAAVRVYHRGDTSHLVEDELAFLNAKDSILLGREYAERRNLHVGSTLSLATPTGVKPFTVRGLLEPEGLAKTLGGRIVVMDVYAAQLAFTARGQINRIDLLVTKGQEKAVARAVAARLPEGLKVEEPSLRKDVVRRTVAGFQAMLTAFALLAVLAGLVICYSRLASIFEARTWEIGLLRAVGLRRGVVFLELLKESLLLGVVGTACGIAVGRFIGAEGLPIVATTTALNFRLPLPDAAIAMTPQAIWLGVFVGLTAAILAAALPALRLARKQPIAALTMRGRELPSSGPPRAGGAGLGLLVTAAVLVVLQLKTQVDALGIVTTGVLALVACIAARPLVHLGSRVLVPLWGHLFGPPGRFAAGHVDQQGRSVALTIATLGIGLGAVTMFGVLAWSFEQTLVTVLTTRMQADLVVNSAMAGSGYVGAPIDEALLDDLSEVPGVALVAGERQRDVQYRDGDVVLDAYDPVCFQDRRVCEWALDAGALPDARPLVGAGQAAFVSSSFAHAHGTKAGDTVELATPHGPLAMRVAGVTNGQPASAVILSRHLYRGLWNDTQLSWVHVAAADRAQVGRVKTDVENRLGRKYRLNVRTSAALIGYFVDQVRTAFQFLYVMEAVIFLLVVVAIGDTLATSVLERTRVFGMMRAVGLRRSRLVAMVLLEGATIGLLGLLLALGTGTVLGVFWVEVQFPALLGWALDLHFPFWFVAGAAGLTLLLCILASILPSVRAGRLMVTAALRAE